MSETGDGRRKPRMIIRQKKHPEATQLLASSFSPIPILFPLTISSTARPP
jgi:hypothetical protein